MPDFVKFVLGSFYALTLKLPIQTSLPVAPELSVSLHSGEKCEKFRKTSTPLNYSTVDSCGFQHQETNVLQIMSLQLE